MVTRAELLQRGLQQKVRAQRLEEQKRAEQVRVQKIAQQKLEAAKVAKAPEMVKMFGKTYRRADVLKAQEFISRKSAGLHATLYKHPIAKKIFDLLYSKNHKVRMAMSMGVKARLRTRGVGFEFLGIQAEKAKVPEKVPEKIPERAPLPAMPVYGPQLPPPPPEYIPGVTGWEISAAPKRTIFSKILGTAEHYLGVAGRRVEEIYVEPVKELVKDIPEMVSRIPLPITALPGADIRLGPAVEFGMEAAPEIVFETAKWVKPKMEYVLERPIVRAALDVPAYTPLPIGPPDYAIATVGEVVARPARIASFLAKMAAKGAEISYEETIAKLPPELRPGRLVSTGEEYRQIMKDVREGKVKREDVDWSMYIDPYTPEEFGRVVEVGARVAPYVVAGPLVPALLASDVVAAREDYKDAPELAKSEAERSWKEYEGDVSKEEFMNIVVPQYETEIKNQALVAMGISGGVLVGGALWKVGKVLKKFVPKKKFTFAGRKLSQAKYDKLMKQIEQSRIEVAKQEAQVLKLRAEREPLVPKVKMDIFGVGKRKEVIGSVEKLTMADDLFNLKVFKTEKEAVKFVEGMTKTRTGVKRVFLEKPGLPKVPEAYITGAESFTLSSSLSTARGDKMVQFSYQLGAQGKPINVHLQLVTIPKGSKHSEILFYKAGKSSVKTIKKDGLIIKREMHNPYVLVDRLVADVGKVKVGKIDETIWRMYQPNFRRVKFKKTRLSHYELLDDWVDKIPPKKELKSLFEAGKKTEKHLMIERLSPTDIEARLGLVGRRDLFGVRAEVIKPYDVTIWGVGKKEAPDLIRIPPWMKKAPPKIKPTPPVVFEVIPSKIKAPQILVTKEVAALKLPPPTIIPPPPKIKIPVPKIKITPPVTKPGVELPYMVGGLGLKEVPYAWKGLYERVDVGVIDRKVLDRVELPSKILPAVIPTIIPKVIPRVIPRVITDVIPREIPAVIPTVIPKVIPRVIPRVIPKVKPRVVTRVAPRVITEVVPRVIPAVVTPRVIPRPPKKPVKYFPLIKLEVPTMKRFPPKKKPPLEKGYGIEIRRKKKWVRIDIPYAFATPEGAHAVGMARTVREAAASYRVVKSLKPVKRTRKKPSPYHKVLFRPGKEKNVMVQKKLLRITSPGEIREISLKGAAARRGVQTWGIGKPKKKKKSTKKKKKKGGK